MEAKIEYLDDVTKDLEEDSIVTSSHLSATEFQETSNNKSKETDVKDELLKLFDKLELGFGGTFGQSKGNF